MEHDTRGITGMLLREAAEDHVALWKVLWMVKDELHPSAQADLKEATLGLLSDLLEADYIRAGFPRGRLNFDPWDLPTDEAIERIRREWDALGREPDIAEIAWFDITQEGQS